MLIGKEFLLSQIGMNRGEGPLIADGSLSRLDMGDQLWGVFITSLREMHFVPYPQRRSLLPIASIEVIGGVDELSSGQRWFWTPPSTLLSWLKLLRAIWCAGWRWQVAFSSSPGWQKHPT